MNNNFYNPSKVKEQYKSSNNLDARIKLHTFNTNKTDWNNWFFERMDIPKNARILELGCGNGILWQKNVQLINKEWDITLSDFSEGMLESARQNIGNEPFKYQIIDIQDIPYVDETFDVVIARHMLYHIPDIDKAICEVRRVLKPGGKFYVSTNGMEHLQELEELVTNYDANLDYNLRKFVIRFGLENGLDILDKHFGNVHLEELNGQIVIDKAEYVVGYVCSSDNFMSDPATRDRFHTFVEEQLLKSGSLGITTRTGIFTMIKG